MEVKAMKKSEAMIVMVAMAIVLLIWAPKIVESAFGIDINPCTVPQCVAACKKALNVKYQSATCATGPRGKYCICLG
ncbi:hypothetical protein A4A49_55294 [Nicotiana attenuata]|uniref:Uncharacterized protein n=1 Tax=Nicotiana attenuata TaxID=49451 RepID=A0A314KXY4_NICAT|nr:hypothetical protein A4A49_55294 [Nicotiana attenuata]